MLNVTPVHNISTIFLEDNAVFDACREDTALRGEVYSFQLVLSVDTPEEAGLYQIQWEKSPLSLCVRIVDFVAVRNTATDPDDDYLRTSPGLYPDVLQPLPQENAFHVLANQKNLLWVTVRVPETAAPGGYRLKFRFAKYNQTEPCWESVGGESIFTLNILKEALPAQSLYRLEWFYADCVANAYHETAWSESHWKHVESFLKNAFDHGINVLYTPLWTQPLDTAIDHYRTDCQLLTIAFNPATGRYAFDFARLERYIDLGLSIGMKRFAMSHLFSQWGATATPPVRVSLPSGEYVRKFGWDVPSDSPEYHAFLEQLFPELLSFFERKGILDKVRFAVSDEPSDKQLAFYERAVKSVRPFLKGLPTQEALSDVDFYKRGLVTIPVPITSRFEDFEAVPHQETWVYYCCGPQAFGPNRFMAMPRRRIRSLGILAYVYNVTGFLHWGFNFYYTQYSWRPIDPFATVDAGGAFPAGDPFLVYPGADGTALDSIRHEVLREAMQDLRACRLAEAKIGREATLDLIGRDVTWKNYPRTNEQFLAIRQRIYNACQK